MAERALVLSCDAWSMTDEKTGQLRTGHSVHYVVPYRDPAAGQSGFKPMKISAPATVASSLAGTSLPAVCDLEYGAKPGPEGKAALVLAHAKVIRPLPDLFTAGK